MQMPPAQGSQPIQWTSQIQQQQKQQMPAESGGLEGEAGTGDDGSGEETNDGLASPFLAKIPENERDIVGKYVKQWDAGVTRRFQELHGKYSPYEELGELETLQRAKEIYDILDQDPERLYNALAEMFQGEGGEEDQQQQSEFENTEDLDPRVQSLVNDLQGRLEQQNQVLEAVAQYILNQDQQSKESQEDSELDEYLGLLKDEFGEFDEDYVLTKMYHGMDGGEAVESWQNLVQQHVNQAGSVVDNLPTILSSSGGSAAPAQESPKLGSVPSRDIRNLVADIMSQTRQGAQ